MIFNEGLDDRVIEYMKLILMLSYLNQHPDAKIEEIRFFKDNDEIMFLFYLEGEKTLAAQFNMPDYLKIAADIKDIIEEKSKDVYTINSEWASTLYSSHLS